MSSFTLFSFLYLCVSYFYSYIMTLSLSRVRALSETLAMLACVGGATAGVAGARRRATRATVGLQAANEAKRRQGKKCIPIKNVFMK